MQGGKYGFVKKGPLTDEEKKQVMTYAIAPYGSGTHEVVIEADIKNKNDDGMRVLMDFWSKWPIVECKNFFAANPNQIPAPLYTLEDVTETKENKVVDVKRRRMASQKYEAMSGKDQRNVGYFFGIANADEIYQKDENDLYLMLLDVPGGIIYNTSPGDVSNMDKFLGNADVKTKTYPMGVPPYSPSDERTQTSINARRAVEKKVIDFNGKTYFINNHPVGETIEQVIGYLETNRDFYYTYVIERLGDAAIYEKKKERRADQDKIETLDITALRAEAKALFEEGRGYGLKGLGVAKYAQIENPEKLKTVIEEAKQEVAKWRPGGGVIQTVV